MRSRWEDRLVPNPADKRGPGDRRDEKSKRPFNVTSWPLNGNSRVDGDIRVNIGRSGNREGKLSRPRCFQANTSGNYITTAVDCTKNKGNILVAATRTHGR